MTTGWRGVIPAVTTQFNEDLSIDFENTRRVQDALVNDGVHGLIVMGTCGENNSLDPDEKRQILKGAVEVVAGRVPAGPFSFARVSSDDRHGRMQAYVGDGEFVDDPLDTFGSRAVVPVPRLQALMRHICKHGSEHHAAMNRSHAAAVLHEAFTTYFGWEVYYHGGPDDGC